MSSRLLTLLVAIASAPALAADDLVPLVVAAVDIPAGTVVTIDMLSQRKAPKAVITSSVVKPDSASYVINQRTTAPLLQGDVLLWSSFETQKGEIADACADKMKRPGSARAQVAQHRDGVLKKR